MGENKIYNAFDKKHVNAQVGIVLAFAVIFFLGTIASAICAVFYFKIGLFLAIASGCMFIAISYEVCTSVARMCKKVKIEGDKIYLLNCFGKTLKEIKNSEYFCFTRYIRFGSRYSDQTRDDYLRRTGKSFLNEVDATTPDYLSPIAEQTGTCLIFSNGKQLIANNEQYKYYHCKDNDIIVIQNPELIKELMKLDILKHYIPTTNPFE